MIGREKSGLSKVALFTKYLFGGIGGHEKVMAVTSSHSKSMEHHIKSVKLSRQH